MVIEDVLYPPIEPIDQGDSMLATATRFIGNRVVTPMESRL